MKHAKEFLARIALNGIRDRNDVEQVRRIGMLKLIGITGIAILIPMGIVVMQEGLILLSALDFSAAALLIGNLVCLERNKNYGVASTVGVKFMGAFSFFLVSGGTDFPRLLEH
jgi:hypothetical protein